MAAASHPPPHDNGHMPKWLMPAILAVVALNGGGSLFQGFTQSKSADAVTTATAQHQRDVERLDREILILRQKMQQLENKAK